MTSCEGHVLGVGDFNGDGTTDLIVADADSASVAILPGHGDATFADPRLVAATNDVAFAISSDLDADARRDLIVGAEGFTVAVFPGNGDFTFGPEVTLAANASPHDGIIADFNSTVFDVTGGGADIWGTSDQFSDLYQERSGDGTIVARVRGLQNAHAWSKAGVMFRETIAANAKQVDMIVSSSKGIAMQFRGATGEATASAGDVFTAEWSTDGSTWTTIGRATVPMPPTILVGLAVTSHNASATAAASFDDVASQQP